MRSESWFLPGAPSRSLGNEGDEVTCRPSYGRAPAQLVALLARHREAQARDRAIAGELWHEGGWVFASATGQPVHPSTDYHQWKALLRKAGVRAGRLHDARHSAATALLVLGVPERTVMSIMGWSSTSMAARYQHVTDPIRRTVADRLDGLLWDDQGDDPELRTR